MSAEENFFILIDWDPADLDPTRIKKRIAEKYTEWSKQANIQGPRGVKANAAKNRSKDIEALLVEHKWRGAVDEIKFQETVAEAKEILKGQKNDEEKELGRIIKFCETKGYVSQEEVGKLVKKFVGHFSEAEIRGRIRVEIRAGAEKAKTEAVKPMLESRYKQIREDLDLAGAKDLFDFLVSETDAFSRKSSSKALHQRANELYTVLYRQNNPTDKLDAQKRLIGAAQQIFDEKNPERRKKYELSLDYERIAFLAERMQWAASDGKLNPTVYEMLLREGMETGASRELVEQFLAQEGIKKGLALVKPVESALYDQEACPACGKLNKSSDKHCGHCSAPLAIDCPACGQTARGSDTACVNCGFQIGEMSRAVPKVEEARTSANRGDFAVALVLLAEAERYWPKLASAQKVREAVEASQKSHQATLERVREHVAAGELLQAEALIKSTRMAGAIQRDLETEIARRRRLALECCRAAQEHLRKRHEEGAFNQLVKAMAVAQDLPEVKQLARQLAPAPPHQPTVTVNGTSVAVRWVAPATATPLQYCVLRRNLSAGETQGRPLNTEVASPSYIDSDVRAGQTYEYAVAARRAGITSPQSPASEPITVTAEVTALSVIPGDRCLNLSWEPPEGAFDIRVVARMDVAPKNLNDGNLLGGVTRRGVTAFDLENQSTHGYRVAAVFRSATGKEVASPGIVITAKVQSLPPRIDHLALHYIDGKIEASWPPCGRSRIHLLHIQGPPIASGVAVDMAQLDTYGVKMPIANDSSARFDPPTTGTVTFTILTEQDGIAVVGASASVEVVVQKARIREIYFRVQKAGLVRKRYYIELFTHNECFRTPELAVYYSKKAPPRQPPDGQFLQRILPLDLDCKPARIDLDGERLAGGNYIGLLVADPLQATNFRVFKPSLNTLKIL